MADGLVCDEDVRVPAGPVELTGRLCIPESAAGIVVFAHGSGSSRHSTRNRYVAGVLNDAGFATLLFDLLTSAEERDRNNVFDIDLLAQPTRRCDRVASWQSRHRRASGRLFRREHRRRRRVGGGH